MTARGAGHIEHSAVYKGWVRHRRFVPKAHAFTYPLLMWYLDLDELEAVAARHRFVSLESFNILSFKRKDYYAPEQGDLKRAVISRVEQELGIDGITRVRMLTHMRYLGYLFNPVTFYYCFDAQGALRAILAEITNTPWGERHAYALAVESPEDRHHRFDFDKRFHVSPFNPMEMQYHWVFSNPEQHLRVHMDNTVDVEAGRKHFDATLVLTRQSLQDKIGRLMIRHPLETVKVTTGIYWQALRLWLKGVPFHNHPKYEAEASSAASTQEFKG